MRRKVEANNAFLVETEIINAKLNEWDVKRIKTGEEPQEAQLSEYWKRYVKVANQIDKAGISKEPKKLEVAKKLVRRFAKYAPLYKL